MSPNFAVRWYEIDPAYQVMRVLAWLRIIDFGEKRQVARMPTAASASAKERALEPAGVAASLVDQEAS